MFHRTTSVFPLAAQSPRPHPHFEAGGGLLAHAPGREYVGGGGGSAAAAAWYPNVFQFRHHGDSSELQEGASTGISGMGGSA